MILHLVDGRELEIALGTIDAMFDTTWPRQEHVTAIYVHGKEFLVKETREEIRTQL